MPFPRNLLEAELFGHVKGAFTGRYRRTNWPLRGGASGYLVSRRNWRSAVWYADQAFAGACRKREIQRLGSGENVKVDFRLIAACNVNLEERIREGKFREDLFYRLNILPIEMPPLRERREDIPLLVQHFIAKVCASESIAMKEVSPENDGTSATTSLARQRSPARKRRGNGGCSEWGSQFTLSGGSPVFLRPSSGVRCWPMCWFRRSPFRSPGSISSAWWDSLRKACLTTAMHHTN